MDARTTPWAVFAREQPEFSARVAARFLGHPHHVLATIRRDGSPRVSGVNVRLADGEMWIGFMPGSRKGQDLERDPRMSIHSAPLHEDLAGGDASVSGLAIPASPDQRARWMSGGPDGDASVIALSRVHMVELEGEELVISTWEPGHGLRIVRRR